MGEQPIQRRLVAVLAADVVGYTRLMEFDTDGTVAAWQDVRAAVIRPQVADHSGIIVKLTGDGFLVEFATVQDAVKCAVAMQSELSSSPLDFRMGINLGDIIDDGEDIHGEGVNVAARLEGLAEPGGICISGAVYDLVRNRVDVPYTDLGEKKVKHVSAPVRVYGVGLASSPGGPVPTQPAPTALVARENKKLELPDIPSVAVLPFDNMSDDPEQEHFADGMTEDLITDLSKVSGLFVVARNSSFAYKGQSPDVRTVATELGVRYVVEGSVRKMGRRVRINVQLIDAIDGGHLWAERYDGLLENVFELQDEVGVKIVSGLSVRLTRNEATNLKQVHTKNLDAYALFITARATPYPPIPERIKSACEMFERVIEIDPEFAGGYAGLSAMLSFGAIWSHVDESEAIARALELAHKAISVDQTFGWSYTSLGMALLQRKQFDDAAAAAREAIIRQPNDADAHAYLGLILGLAGAYAEAVVSIDQARRLNPQFFNGPYLNIRGQIQMLAGDYGAAIQSYDENRARLGPVGPPALSQNAAAYIGLGQEDKAFKVSQRLRAEFPKFSTINWNFLSLIRDHDVRDRVIGQMRAAGVPNE